ncbi:ABC transporter permease [Nonomuraea sp. NPDC051191]|uniref:ABC transporter permease n=1 Tax=Nonomuraea sp. NPDC051191 TaxID=3364372 RepID=UPI00378B5DB5
MTSVSIEEALRPSAGLRRRLTASPLTYLSASLAAMIAVFSVAAPEAFLSAYNIQTMLTVTSVLLVLSVGMTFVIATAGIDLSVGSVLVFSAVMSLRTMTALGGSGFGVVLAGFAVAVVSGVVWGTLNGLLVAKAKVPALISTLGTMGAALGIAQLVTGGNDLSGVPKALYETVGLGKLFGVVPWLVVIALVVTVAGAVVLNQTKFGRYTLFVGSGAEAARRSGINVDLHLIKVYGLAGLLAGVAGFLDLALFASANIAGHSTDNLQAVAAVVLGGTSLFGGVATIPGTVIGVFIPAVLQNGFVILKVQTFWQEVAIGVVLVLAVYIDQLKRKSREKS